MTELRETIELLEELSHVLNPGRVLTPKEAEAREAKVTAISGQVAKKRPKLAQGISSALGHVQREIGLLSRLDHDLNSLRQKLSFLDQIARIDDVSQPSVLAQVSAQQVKAAALTVAESLKNVREQAEGVKAVKDFLGL